MQSGIAVSMITHSLRYACPGHGVLNPQHLPL